MIERLRSLLLPLLVGGLALGITVWIWDHERDTEQARLRAVFEAGVRQAATRIEQRMASYEQMLRGAQGLLIASDEIDQRQFAGYVDAVLAGSDAVGLREIAYGRLQSAIGIDVGGPRNDLVAKTLSRAPVLLVAPSTRAIDETLGYDPMGDPARREAMLRACDSGSSAITRQVMLGGADRQGFLMFLPLYRSGQAIDTQASRRAHVRGWVWASFRYSDMLSSVYGERMPGLELQVYDGVELDQDSLLYGPVAAAAAQSPARFEAQEYLGFAGHTWTLNARSQPQFDTVFQRATATVIAAAGTVLSLILGLLTFQLVTGRARAQATAEAMTRELRDSETRYRRIVDTAQEGIWMTDPDGRLSFVNPMMQRLLAAPGDALVGRLLSDFVDDPALARQFAERMIERPVAIEHDELRVRAADDSLRWLLVSVSPIHDSHGAHLGALGMATDITERQHAQTRRQQLEAQLRESQKMEAIGTLAGGIAHDFNNILAVILGNVANARHDIAAGRSALAGLQQIDMAAVRARMLVQQILAFSQAGPKPLISQPLRPMIDDALTLLRATLPAQIELQLELDGEPIHVGVDAAQVQQVLMNLCTNAWHALVGRHGTISISIGTTAIGAADAPAELGRLQPGRYALLRVSDNGCGMDEATRLRAFDPFFTTKLVGHGTGLGLSVVHGIVAAQHGAIEVTSEPGSGSRFDIYLPLLEPADLPLAPSAAASSPATGRCEHVLYIDDDPAMLLMVEALLQREGYRVSVFGSARQALPMIKDDPASVDLVVTDHNMPDQTGLEFAQALAGLAPRLPVLITSGYISDELRSAAGQAGVRSVLQKEFTFEQLGALVRRTLDDAQRTSR